jgi:hypothetical protein
LRSILYIDEVFGYLPPVAGPPSKLPLLTLLKQARAFGLGVVLATQNPIDLDYKALSNAGTWFLGRLQTERDKERVLDGLEGAAVSGQKQFNRRFFDQMLSGLGNRIFLMNNVHEDVPVVFETRWAMSYLRGPLTRDQIKILMEPTKKQIPTIPAQETTPIATSTLSASSRPTMLKGASKPMVPPEVPEYFMPLNRDVKEAVSLIYHPMIVGAAQVVFSDQKSKVNIVKEQVFLAPVTDNPIPVNWDDAEEANMKITELRNDPQEDYSYAELPPVALQKKNYAVWTKDFTNWLTRTQRIQLFKSPRLNEISRPEETERDFRIRLEQKAREERDMQVAKLRQKYTSTFSRLDERVRKAKMALDEQQAQAKSQKYQVAVSIGEAILGGFLGRKSTSRASRATRAFSRSQKESRDKENAEKNLKAAEQERARLEQQFQDEVKNTETKINSLTETLENIQITPSKTDIAVRLLALVWATK